MSSTTKQVQAQNGHTLDVYVAMPGDEPVGAVVVIQEIFGVNGYIRRVADAYAAQGYVALAPALFDRVERGVELSYEGEDMQRAVGLMRKLNPQTALLDVGAAFHEAKAFGRGVGIVGFCYGGYMSWLSATRGEEIAMRPDCCIGYYPGGIGAVATEEPSCPVMLHFGEADTHIGPEQVEAVRANHPEVEVLTYPGAEHGFSCDARGSFQLEAAALAQQRTLEFLRTHLA